MSPPVDPHKQASSSEATETATPESAELNAGPTVTAASDRDAAVAFIDGLAPKTRERYDVGEEVGRGGLGRILEAFDTELGRKVAIKELLHREPRAEARFVREATITARLEHPAIVPVHEAGRWPDGDPFYAMKLVNGRRLKEVVKEAKGLKERLALLPHVLAVADALAYSHAEGIIHRDLKPSNLLVGAYGETVVIDWGLAKDLDVEHDDDDPLSVTETGTGDDVTIAGAVVGTPAYMSPEQARGETVDERTDVYAIGAVLYYVLSGTPPFSAKTSGEVLSRVRAGRPIAIDERVPDAPADLATIVRRAMAPDLAARYADAGALAADLRRYQEGQLVGAHDYSTWQLVRRWVGRHRAAVAVAALMTVVLLAVAIIGVTRIAAERDRAETQRSRAETERAEAEQLMEFMVGDLHERLEPIGKLDTLGLVADRAAAYWAKQPVDWSKPDDALKRAIAHSNIGDVLQARGDNDAAMAQYEICRSICEHLLEDDSSDVRARRVFGLVHGEIGNLQLARGDTDAAMASFETYAKTFERQFADDPSNGWALHEVHVAKNRIGEILLERGDSAGALAVYRVAKEISEKLLVLDPSNDIWRFGLAATKTYVARVYRETGDSERALAEYRTAVVAYDEIVANNPDDTHYLRSRAVLHENIGDMLIATGDRGGALEQFLASKAIYERLVRWEPDNAKWQYDLAGGYDRIGYEARATNPDDALVALRAAKEIRLRLQRRDPDNSEWEIVLAMTLNLLGDVLRDIGDLDGALAEYEAAMEIRRRLVARDADNAEWAYDLALGHNMLGDIAHRKGQVDLALSEYLAGLEIRERLVAASPDNIKHQKKLALSHLNLAAVYEAKNDATRRREHLFGAGKIYERFATTGNDFYNAACVFALSREPDKAFDMLASATANGFRMADWAAKDPDLSSLHDDARWQPALAKMRE